MSRESIVIVRRGSRLLALKRCAADGGYWHVAGGGVEAGETHVAAASRELMEEIGLVDAAPRDLDFPYVYEAIEGRIFVVDVPGGWEPTLNDEHDDYRWCKREEYASLMHWPETVEVLDRL